MLLNGIWSVRGKDEKGNVIEFKGSVPGCVHTDMIEEGIIKDIYYRDNSEKIRWIEENDYTYSRSFYLEHIEENARLEFDGLDTYAEIILNGVTIGNTDNMHIPYAFLVDGILKEGENLLEVCFRSPVKEVEGKPSLPAAFTNERVHTRRIQCTYGWDWVDRFVTMGIFRDVRLVFGKANEIDNVYVYTKDVNSDYAQVKINVELREAIRNGDSVSFEITAPDRKVCFSKSRTILKDSLYEYVDVKNPKLWYPAGYGAQPLYTLKITTPSSSEIIKFGIRKITILQAVDEEGSIEKEIAEKIKSADPVKNFDKNSDTSSFIVLVNDVRIMCKGGNWVPCEPFPSAEAPEKITRLLELAVDSGANMLRVWGGGIFERDEFYNECDRLGILVTQDFLMACGKYPESEEWFSSALKEEAKAACLRLRNHPCLAWWSGDNENAVMGNENITEFDGYIAATESLEPVVTKYDPERYFLPSSPYGGEPFCSATRGTTHCTYYLGDIFGYVKDTDMKDYREYFSRFLFRFNAEQGVLGMPFVSSLKKFMTDEDIFGDDTYMSEFHTKNNPGLPVHTIYEYVDIMSRKIFGEFKDGADRVLKMQMLQCDWVRLSLELARRNKWYSSGIIYWMYNDCWPAANGWSLVDYYAAPKPSYYAFKRVAKPVIGSIYEENGVVSVYACNDSLTEVSGSGKIYVYDFIKGENLWEDAFDFSVNANVSEKVYSNDFEAVNKYLSETTIILCDIYGDDISDRAMFVKDRFKDLDINYCDVKILKDDDNEITVSADEFLPYAVIDVPYLLEDNCFVLKKGETKTIKKIKRL